MGDKNSSADPFEDNLRQILSNESVTPVRQPLPADDDRAARPSPYAPMPDEAAAKTKSERLVLFLLKILRPVAAAAAIAALLIFIGRITAQR